MNREMIIREMDELVYSLLLDGLDEDSIFGALREYLEIQEELTHAPSI